MSVEKNMVERVLDDADVRYKNISFSKGNIYFGVKNGQEFNMCVGNDGQIYIWKFIRPEVQSSKRNCVIYEHNEKKVDKEIGIVINEDGIVVLYTRQSMAINQEQPEAGLKKQLYEFIHILNTLVLHRNISV